MRSDVFLSVAILCQQLMVDPCYGIYIRLSGSASYAVQGQSFQFTCTISNLYEKFGYYNTDTSVKFVRDGSTVKTLSFKCPFGAFSGKCTQSYVYKMSISSVSQSDERTWVCKSLSRTSNSVRLTVHYGPGSVSIDRSSPQTLVEGSSLTVRCSTSCSQCKYVWKEGWTTASTSSQLSLYNVKRTDAGRYTCTATNTKTRKSASSSTLTVYVKYTPEVKLQSSCRPYRVYEGQTSARLTCKVISADPPVTSYVWTRNGNTQIGSGSVYYFGTVSRSDGGTYACAGRNSVGISSTRPSVKVDVQYAPTVSVPSAVTVIEEKTLTVHCDVDAFPTASIRWTRQGGGSFTPQYGSTLTIGYIQKSQEGTYVCIATNSLSPCNGGSPPSNPVSKQVIVTVKYKRHYVVVEFRPLEINCTKYVTQGDTSSASFTWTGPGGFTFTGAILYIASTNRTNTGGYSCIVNNIAGWSQTVVQKFTVDVQYPPAITSFTINSNTVTVTVAESDYVTMRCVVDSNPRSTVRLFNGSIELARTLRSFSSEHSWIAGCRQRGDYSCAAANTVGGSVTGARHINLLVTCSPRLEESCVFCQQFASLLGGNISLSVPLMSYPEPNVTWIRNGTEVNSTYLSSVISESDISFVASLKLTDVQEDDFGEYLLQADNGVERSIEYIIKLVRAGPPNMPTNLTIVSQTANSLTAAWKQEFNRGSTQTFTVEYSTDELSWKEAGFVMETSERAYLQMDITGLSPQTVYYVRVAATNQHGTTYTESIRAKTLKYIISEETAGASTGGLIAGVTVGVLVGVAAIVGVVLLVRRKFKRTLGSVGVKKNTPSKTEIKNKNASKVQSIRLPDLYAYLSEKRVNSPVYTDLKEFENASITSADTDHTYLEIQSTASESNFYEEINPPGHVDTQRNTIDQPSTNTPRHSASTPV